MKLGVTIVACAMASYLFGLRLAEEGNAEQFFIGFLLFCVTFLAGVELANEEQK